MAAINNCTTILTDPQGPYQLTPAAALAASPSLTLDTNAESCPMCASAVRRAGFREYVCGTSIDALVAGLREVAEGGGGRFCCEVVAVCR